MSAAAAQIPAFLSPSPHSRPHPPPFSSSSPLFHQLNSLSSSSLTHLNRLLSHLPYSHSPSNQACIILALLLALVVTGHNFGYTRWSRRRKELKAEKTRTELLLLVEERKKVKKTDGHLSGSGSARKRSGNSLANGNHIPGASNHSQSQSQSQSTRSRSVSNVSMSSKQSLLSPMNSRWLKTHDDEGDDQRQSDIGLDDNDENDENDDNENENDNHNDIGNDGNGLEDKNHMVIQHSTSPSTTDIGGSSDRLSARKRQKAKKAEKKTRARQGSIAHPEEVSTVVSRQTDRDTKKEMEIGTDSSGFGSSSLGLSLMITAGSVATAENQDQNQNQDLYRDADPMHVPLPTSPEFPDGSFRSPRSAYIASFTRREDLPTFPPSDEPAIRQQNGQPARKPSRKLPPVGAPGWSRDEPHEPKPPTSPMLSTTSFSSSSPSKNSAQTDVSRERDQLAFEVARLEKEVKSTKDRESAAKKQTARAKDEASKSFNECLKARDDIARVRQDAERALRAEITLIKDLNDLKREIYLRDQEHRRRESELETILQQRSAQLAQAYHTMMLLQQQQQNGLATPPMANPAATVVLPGSMPHPHSPFPTGTSSFMSPHPHPHPHPHQHQHQRQHQHQSIPPSSSQMGLLPDFTTPPRPGFMMDHHSSSSSPIRHSPTSPIVYLAGQIQMPTSSNNGHVPEISRDIASSVLKHRRASSKSTTAAAAITDENSRNDSSNNAVDLVTHLASDSVTMKHESKHEEDVDDESTGPPSPSGSSNSCQSDSTPLVFASIHHDPEQLRASIHAERMATDKKSSADPSMPSVPSLSGSTSESPSPASFSPRTLQHHTNSNGRDLPAVHEAKIVIRTLSSQGPDDTPDPTFTYTTPVKP